MESDQYEHVREVHVKIGVLSCVDPKILSHVFTYITEDTPFNKSILFTKQVEIIAACEDCKMDFKVENYRFVCPVCEKPSSVIIAGNELTIYKIILEEPSYAKVDE